MPILGSIYRIRDLSTSHGPGMRTVISFKGCPLHCPWCPYPEAQDPHSQLMTRAWLCTACGACVPVCREDAIVELYQRCVTVPGLCTDCGDCAKVCPEGVRQMIGAQCTVEQIMHHIHENALFFLNSEGGVTFNGGECMLQPAFLQELLAACVGESVHTCVETCGQVDRQVFQDVFPLVDLLVFDLKILDPGLMKRCTGGDAGLIAANLEHALSEGADRVSVRMTLLSEVNDTDESLETLAGMLLPYGVRQVEVRPRIEYEAGKLRALNRTVTRSRDYTPSQLMRVFQRFAGHGLEAKLPQN